MFHVSCFIFIVNTSTFSFAQIENVHKKWVARGAFTVNLLSVYEVYILEALQQNYST